MKIKVVLGRAQPSQTLPRVEEWGNPVSPFPCGAGRGETRFPHTPPPRSYVHGSRLCGCAAQRRDEHRLGARAARPRRVSAGKVTAPLPSPPPAGGRESGSSPRRGEVRRGVQRRMRVGEQPMFTLAVYAAAPRTDGMNILPGRATPSQTLPRAEVGGNPVSPYPCARAAPPQSLPRAGVWGNLVPPCSR